MIELPNKDRQTIERYMDGRKSFWSSINIEPGNISQLLAWKLATLRDKHRNDLEIKNTPQANNNPDDSIYWTILSLKGIFLDYSVYSYYSQNRPEGLLIGLHTYGRLTYLDHALRNLIRGSETDSTFIWDYLPSAASYDIDMLRAYITNVRFPLKPYFRFAEAIARGLEVLIGEKAEQHDSSIALLRKVSEQKSIGKYEKALVTCILAILTKDVTTFSETLQTVLDMHKKGWSPSSFSMLSYVALPAHALYNIAYFSFTEADFEPPQEPEHKYWDHDLWLAVKDRAGKFAPGEYIIDFEKESPILAQWMDELPAMFDFEAFWKSLE